VKAPGRLGSAAVSRTSSACQAPRTADCGVNWGSNKYSACFAPAPNYIRRYGSRTILLSTGRSPD
jgi:hypothetical protein